jgi:DNA-binding LacI/PurR family transcriptional regulator
MFLSVAVTTVSHPAKLKFSPPRRISLVEQTVALLRQHIEHREWRDFLPPENLLTKELGVSRVTLRKAVSELISQGLIKPGGRGYRNQILGAAGDLAEQKIDQRVHFLSPISEIEMVPSTRVIYDEIRLALLTYGCSMEFDHRKSLWCQSPAAKLQALTQGSEAGAWILYRASVPIQQWFQANQVRCVVLGPCHAGVTIPSVEFDVKALGRHVGGECSRLGHRHVAFVANDLSVASSQATQAGLAQQLQPCGKLVKISVVEDDYTQENLRSALKTLMAEKEPPTCLIASAAGQAWPLIGILQEMGLRVPEDVSLVVRDHEAFLARSVPKVTRYTFDIPRFGRLAAGLLRSVLSSGGLRQTHRQVQPVFLAGQTLVRRKV